MTTSKDLLCELLIAQQMGHIENIDLEIFDNAMLHTNKLGHVTTIRCQAPTVIQYHVETNFFLKQETNKIKLKQEIQKNCDKMPNFNSICIQFSAKIPETKMLQLDSYIREKYRCTRVYYYTRDEKIIKYTIPNNNS